MLQNPLSCHVISGLCLIGILVSEVSVVDPGFLKGGGADLTGRYRNNQRQNRLSDSFVSSIISSLNDPKEGGG